MASAQSVVTTNGSYISPVNQRLYAQSNLLGTWSGKMNGKDVTFKVDNIRGSVAQVEFSSGSTKEHGTATVDKNMVTYGAFTVATKNGKNGVLVFESGNVQKSYAVTKTASFKATTAKPVTSSSSSSSASSAGASSAVNLLV